MVQPDWQEFHGMCGEIAEDRLLFQVRSSYASNLIFEFAHNISSTTTTTAHTNDTANPNPHTLQSHKTRNDYHCPWAHYPTPEPQPHVIPQALGHITIDNMTTIQCWLMRDSDRLISFCGTKAKFCVRTLKISLKPRIINESSLCKLRGLIKYCMVHEQRCWTASSKPIAEEKDWL